MANFANIGQADVAVTNSTAIASTASETAFSGGFSLTANTLAIGDTIKAEWSGVHSTTLSPTMQFRIRYGTTSGVLVLDFGAVSAGTGVTNRSWKVMFTGTVRTIGASGTLAGSAILFINNGATELVTGAAVTMSTNSTVTIDTTTTTSLNLTLQWSASSASNTATRINEFFAKSA